MPTTLEKIEPNRTGRFVIANRMLSRAMHDDELARFVDGEDKTQRLYTVDTDGFLLAEVNGFCFQILAIVGQDMLRRELIEAVTAEAINLGCRKIDCTTPRRGMARFLSKNGFTCDRFKGWKNQRLWWLTKDC